MPTLANDLVQFLMHLFGSREAIQEFLDDPARALEEHGLGNVSSADVDAAMPVVLDYAPIHVNATSFDREPETGGHNAWDGHVSAPVLHAGLYAVGQRASNYDNDDHSQAVQQLQHVVNTFSYTTSTTVLDDRDTFTDQSVNQNIWAHGDVEQWFDNHDVAAAGHRAVAGGDNAGAPDSNNIRDSYNTEDNSTDNSTGNSIQAGGDVSSGNEETDISHSFNTDDSFITDAGLGVEDSFNDNSDHSTGTDVGFDVRDSFNDDSDNSTSTAVDVHQDDAFQDNPAADTVEDSLVVADNQPDFTEDDTTPADAGVDLDNHATVDGSVVDDSTLL